MKGFHLKIEEACTADLIIPGTGAAPGWKTLGDRAIIPTEIQSVQASGGRGD
jgi:hypothetical protein